MEQKGIKIEVKDVEVKGGVKLILIDGVLDVITSFKAELVVNPLVTKEKHLIFDCTNLNYMNTAGLVTLLKWSTQMKKKNGDFKLVNPNKIIYEILDLAGLVSLLEIYPTQEEALNSIREGA